MKSDYLGHVFLCDSCAEKVQLHETFLMIIMDAKCEGCGTPVGYEYDLVEVNAFEGGKVKIMRPTKQIARCWQMWRNEMWPVKLGIKIQDFAGAHRHEFRTVSWSAERHRKKNYTEEICRCGETRTRWEE